MNTDVKSEVPDKPPAVCVYLICPIGGELFAIEAGKVRHVAALEKVWRVPGTVDYVKGVTKVNGKLNTVVDLRLRLGLPEVPYTSQTCVVVLDTPEPIALVVDSVHRASQLDRSQMVPASRLGAGMVRPAVSGVLFRGDVSYVILDPDKLLPDESFSAAAEERKHAVPDTDISSAPNATAQLLSQQTKPVAEIHGAARQSPSAPVCRNSVTSDDSRPTLRLPRSACVSTEEHLRSMMSRPAFTRGRRVPGFRMRDSRLPAVAIALLQAPETFRTCEVAPIVAGLLGPTQIAYRVAQFRYDLAKFRARNLAVRLGNSLRYCLTGIGRKVCESLARSPAAAQLPGAKPTEVRLQRPALSA